jgi:hypothetical protein
MASKCACKFTSEFMAKHGGTHSAKMHAANAQAQDGKWSVRDWKLHFEEEQRILVPLLRKYGLGYAADVIAREHVTLVMQLDRTKTMDEELLRRHSEFEDMIVKELDRRMRAA